MSRWKSKEERDKLTAAEEQYVRETVEAVCGPRPPGTRLDAPVSSWRWARNSLLYHVERDLRKRPTPATRGEVETMVGTRAPSFLES